MQKKNFKDGIVLSRLGMGNMRLPTVGGDREAPIDYEKAQAIIDYAMQNGINYFDTAYVYHGGKSETFLGDALVDRYPRDSFYIATKFNLHASRDYEAVFKEQLQRLHTDHIDFYLLHALGDSTADDYLNMGCIPYFEEQKAKGRIKYLGFSAHMSPEGLEKVASARAWDFAQIQLNYLDWEMQRAKEQYEVLTSHHIPVVVMEPVRGGRLASLNESCDAALKAAQPDWSIASWALRWVAQLDNVQVILSGMSTLEQIQDNVATFADPAISAEDAQKLMDVCHTFRSEISVPCTGCRYCTPECPMGLDIPALMELYNRYKLDGGWALRRLDEMEADKTPDKCIGCGACKQQCPQNIDIPAVMAELAEAQARRKA